MRLRLKGCFQEWGQAQHFPAGRIRWYESKPFGRGLWYEARPARSLQHCAELCASSDCHAFTYVPVSEPNGIAQGWACDAEFDLKPRECALFFVAPAPGSNQIPPAPFPPPGSPPASPSPPPPPRCGTESRFYDWSYGGYRQCGNLLHMFYYCRYNSAMRAVCAICCTTSPPPLPAPPPSPPPSPPSSLPGTWGFDPSLSRRYHSSLPACSQLLYEAEYQSPVTSPTASGSGDCGSGSGETSSGSGDCGSGSGEGGSGSGETGSGETGEMPSNPNLGCMSAPLFITV